MLVHMAHRGGTGVDPASGDGAGIMMGLPHGYFATVCKDELSLTLPPAGEYGTGLFFLPQQEKAQNDAKQIVTENLTRKGLQVLYFAADRAVLCI